MENAFNCIGLIGKYGDPGTANTVLDLSRILQERGIELGEGITLRDMLANRHIDRRHSSRHPEISAIDGATQRAGRLERERQIALRHPPERQIGLARAHDDGGGREEDQRQ